MFMRLVQNGYHNISFGFLIINVSLVGEDDSTAMIYTDWDFYSMNNGFRRRLEIIRSLCITNGTRHNSAGIANYSDY